MERGIVTTGSFSNTSLNRLPKQPQINKCQTAYEDMDSGLFIKKEFSIEQSCKSIYSEKDSEEELIEEEGLGHFYQFDTSSRPFQVLRGQHIQRVNSNIMEEGKEWPIDEHLTQSLHFNHLQQHHQQMAMYDRIFSFLEEIEVHQQDPTTIFWDKQENQRKISLDRVRSYRKASQISACGKVSTCSQTSSLAKRRQTFLKLSIDTFDSDQHNTNSKMENKGTQQVTQFKL